MCLNLNFNVFVLLSESESVNAAKNGNSKVSTSRVEWGFQRYISDKHVIGLVSGSQ